MFKEIYDLAKDLHETAEKNKNTEIAMLAANIIMKLSEIERKNTELHAENIELKRKIEEKETIEEIEKRITRGKSTVAEYTTITGKTLKICSVCWDNEQKTVQMSFMGGNKYYCKLCRQNSFWEA